eukprot:3917030-Pyramimonas_sp.AAC.1
MHASERCPKTNNAGRRPLAYCRRDALGPACCPALPVPSPDSGSALLWGNSQAGLGISALFSKPR